MPSAFDTAMDAVKSAVEDDDVALARKQLALAEIEHHKLSQSVSGDGLSRVRRSSLDAIKARIDEFEASLEDDAGPWEITSRLVP